MTTGKLGCIADDFTGATDLCSSLRRAGRDVVLLLDYGWQESVPDAGVLVVALKSRAEAPPEAIEHSLAAVRALQALGVERFYFKYCSTFDSTPRGNIGPVLDALTEFLRVPATVVCPAHPEQGRTVYQGHLFVGDRLLAESPMAEHPVNPMRDSDVVRLLSAQTDRSVGLIPYAVIGAGANAIRAEFERQRELGVAYLVTDAIQKRDIVSIAAAISDVPLLSGAAGLGGLLGKRASDAVHASEASTERPDGATVILAGSSSLRTRQQVEYARRRVPSLKIDPLSLVSGAALDEVLTWVEDRLDGPGVLVYAGNDPETVSEVQRKLGVETASAVIEETLAAVCRLCVARGVRRFMVAGGETAAAVTRSLGIEVLEVSEDLEPGVPWMRTRGADKLELALKSGNFGSESLFVKAIDHR